MERSPLQNRITNRKSFKGPPSKDSLTLFLRKNEAICKTNQAFIYHYLHDNVLKMVRYEDYTGGRDFCPFRAEFCQALMQELLSTYVVEAGLSPHICMLRGVPVHPFYDQDKKRNVVFFMEHAQMGSLQNYYDHLRRIPSLAGKYLDDYVLLVIFQVAYTLEAIYSVMPNFRHNDLKPSNVFITQDVKPKKGTYTRYTIAAESSFFVPNDLGVTAMIADFDFSSCTGVVDNYKVIEYWAMHPQTNINWKRNHATDLAYFIKVFYRMVRRRISPQLKDTIQGIYGKEYLKKFTSYPSTYTGVRDASKLNHMRGFPEDDANLPSVREVLCHSSLFASYRSIDVSETHCTEAYATASLEKPCEIEWPVWAVEAARRYYREIPIMQNLPECISTKIFTDSMPLRSGLLEEGMGNVYVNYLNDQESLPLLRTLLKDENVHVPIEKAEEIVSKTQLALKRNASCVGANVELMEALLICNLTEIIYETKTYTVDTRNPDAEYWSYLLQDRYNTEQLLQMMLQYTWIKKK